MSRTPPRTASAPLRLRLLWLPEAMPGTLFAALDVARTALGVDRLRRPQGPATIGWQWVAPSGRTIAMPFAGALASPRLRATARQTLIVVPALQVRNAPALDETLARSATALRLLERHAADGGAIAACGTGMVLPAALGLLDGGRVAAPWAYQSWFTRRFPRCNFAGDEPFGTVGRCFTSVAASLQSEFTLRLLGHLHDADLAQACAQVLLHQPQRQRLTPNLVAEQWLTRTSDSPVYRAMQWLQAHIHEPFRMARVAAAAAASERTLLRHFRQVTGMTPLNYLHQLRIERAKMLLEVTLHGVESVAEACGYADTSAFRRLFQREAGMSMSQYRTRYALRARRPMWRVEAGAFTSVHGGETAEQAGRHKVKKR